MWRLWSLHRNLGGGIMTHLISPRPTGLVSGKTLQEVSKVVRILNSSYCMIFEDYLLCSRDETITMEFIHSWYDDIAWHMLQHHCSSKAFDTINFGIYRDQDGNFELRSWKVWKQKK